MVGTLSSCALQEPLRPPPQITKRPSARKSRLWGSRSSLMLETSPAIWLAVLQSEHIWYPIRFTEYRERSERFQWSSTTRQNRIGDCPDCAPAGHNGRHQIPARAHGTSTHIERRDFASSSHRAEGVCISGKRRREATN